MAESRRKHPCWKYVTLVDEKKTNDTKCKFCGRVIKGGIYRHTEHIIGGRKNVRMCPNAPREVREELQKYFNKKKEQKEGLNMMEDFFDVEIIKDDMDYDDNNVQAQVGSKRAFSGSSINSVKTPKVGQNQPRQRGPMDKFVTPNMEHVVRESKRKLKLKQTSISESYKERADLVKQHIARWLYQASIPFNAVRCESFHTMIEAIGQFGPGLKPPSYHDLRGPLLKKEYDYTKDMMKSHKESWKNYGCSIMIDGWTDKRDRTLINFLVNTQHGTMFMESIDGSSYIKTGEKMYELLCKMVEKVGQQNVVQVVTDSASSLVLAGRLLEAKYPNLYWTPCVAQCIDLMFEDIGKMPKVEKALHRAMTVYSFIYNHPYLLNMMREFTKQKELIRPAVTRFATCFLTLQSFHKQKHNLIIMFNSKNWLSSRWAKEQNGKRAATIVMMASFWNDVAFVLKATAPLVHVFRLVHGEEKSAMGYIYKAMDWAKETIKKAFNDNESKYREIFDIIDRRWDIQLHMPLHAASYYLNPEFSYDDENLESDKEVMKGLNHVIGRLVLEDSVKEKIAKELTLYRNAEGLFGIDMAKWQRKIMSPVDWWTFFGASAPNLQKLARRVLGLTCSVLGCERNWSIFEHIHTKKRNKPEQKRVNDLLYIKYNQALKDRRDRWNTIDPISLKDIDDDNEWLVEKIEDHSENVEEDNDDFVYDDEELTWGMPLSSREKACALSSNLSLQDIKEIVANLEESGEEYVDEYELRDDDEEDNDDEAFDEELDE